MATKRELEQKNKALRAQIRELKAGTDADEKASLVADLTAKDVEIERLREELGITPIPYSVVSIDPGKHAVAYALWGHHGDRLEGGGVLRSDSDVFSDSVSFLRRRAEAMGTVRRGLAMVAVVELMTAWPRDRRSQPQDLIAVATVGAAVGAVWARRLVFVRPDQWKGQVPKTVTQHRVRDALNARERAVLQGVLDRVPRGQWHDIYDAVGIGLHHQGRYR